MRSARIRTAEPARSRPRGGGDAKPWRDDYTPELTDIVRGR